MWWASWTIIAEAIEKIILTYVDKDKRLEAGEIVLKALKDQDWDRQDEVDLFSFIWLKENRKNNWKSFKEDGYDDYDIKHYENEYQRIFYKINKS